MGRIALKDLENYGGGGGSSYFSLKNDKDVAKVRIMLDSPEDVEEYIYGVHDVLIGDRHRDVNCLRSYNEPVEKCPFCAEGKKVIPRLYLPLYNEDADEVQIWTRGKGFMSTLSSFIARYSNPHIVSHVVEIERNGKAGDMKTTYGLYEVDKDDSTIEDFPEIPEVLGSMIMDKSADDMNYYLDEGEFPPEDEQEEPVRRRRSRSDDAEEPVRRRRSRSDDAEEPIPFEEDEKPQRSRVGRSSGRRTPNRRNTF